MVASAAGGVRWMSGCECCRWCVMEEGTLSSVAAGGLIIDW